MVYIYGIARRMDENGVGNMNGVMSDGFDGLIYRVVVDFDDIGRIAPVVRLNYALRGLKAPRHKNATTAKINKNNLLFMFPLLYVGIFGDGVEAGAGFNPFPFIDFPVVVCIGRQIAVADDTGVGITLL